MRKTILTVVLAVALAGAAYYAGSLRGADPAAPSAPAAGAAAGGRRGGGGFPGGGFRGARGPMTVEFAKVSRATLADEITVVGNLIGEATVSVVPRTAGRLQDISVRLGDRVSRGQRIAKIEDFEIVEQVKQAEAAQEVALATIRQREADLQLAKTNAERSRSLFERQLLPKQTLDDNEARYQAAIAQLDLARAQNTQSRARLDELRINLANTIITSPVDGFVARRAADPGAFVSQNAPVADVVDITRVRLVANVVEKDLRQLVAGNPTAVQVDAFPGETFTGRIARVSPVLDPATRTAPIEIEIPNPEFRLKPGMYARVIIETNTKKDALVVPATALVDLGGRRGVFVPINNLAVFRMVNVGSEQLKLVEVVDGLKEGDTIITTGSGSLRDGDPFLLAGASPGGRGEGRGRRGGADQAASSNGRGVSQDGPSAGADPPAQTNDTAPSGAGNGRGGRGEFGGRDGRSGSDGNRLGGEGRRGRRGGTPGQAAPGVSQE